MKWSLPNLKIHLIAGGAALTSIIFGIIMMVYVLTPKNSVPNNLPITKVADSLVMIGSDKGYGSGVVIQSNDTGSLIITNKHVCALGDNRTMAILLSDISEYKLLNTRHINSTGSNVAQAIKISTNTDLCLVHTQLKNLPHVKISMKIPTQGDLAFNVSNPAGVKGYVATGRVGLYEYIWQMLYRQVSIPIYGGSSGSGVFNTSGELVGLISLGRTNMNTLSYMVPLEHLHLFLKGVLL